MRPKCDHFTDIGAADHGLCGLKLYGGRPSFGRCNGCEHNADRGRPIDAFVAADELAARANEHRLAKLRAAWHKIHSEALSPDGLTEGKLAEILKGLPCGTCLDHFRPIQATDPLPADVTLHFAVTVRWHNAVSVSIGKPAMSEADARPLYSKPAPSL